MTESSIPTNSASVFAKWLTKYATAVLGVVVFLGLLLIFLQLRLDPEHKSTFYSMTSHLGMAFVIAGILGLTIEQFTKVRHDIHRDDLVGALNKNRLETIEDLQRHVLRAVYQRTLPEALIDAAEETIFKSAFLRTDWRIVYELNRIEGGLAPGSCMSLATTFTYKIANVTKTRKSLSIPTVIDMSSSHYVAERCGVKRVEVNGVAWSPEEISTRTSKKDSTCKFEIEKDLDAGEIIEIRIEYEQLNPQEASEFVSTRYPSTEVDVTAIVPQGDFDLELVSLHQEEPMDLNRSAHYRHWRLGPALFPGQGWALIWKPRPMQPDLNKA